MLKIIRYKIVIIMEFLFLVLEFYQFNVNLREDFIDIVELYGEF